MSLGRKQIVGATAALTTIPFVAALGVSGAGAAEAASCIADVGGTGLSASVVAHSHQRIADRVIDASSCDVGIYIGAGARHVSVHHTTVTGAGYQGIFAEKTSYVRITGSTVTGNAFRTVDESAPPLPGSGVKSYVGQAFAVSLFGVSHGTVRNNKVYNNGRGGIGVMDNGPFDPGARMQNQDPTAPLVATSHVKVVYNDTWANYNGCGIVAATQNLNGRLRHLKIRHNTITGKGFGAAGPDIGGIVVAADLPGSKVRHARVDLNTVRDSFEGGLIVNAEAPGSVTWDVSLYRNVVTGNNTGHLEAPNTVGVIVFAAEGAANRHTMVRRNVLSDQFWGVWSRGKFPPKILGNDIDVTPGGDWINLM